VNVQHGVFNGTPLQYAASNKHVEVVKLLLEHEADPNAKDKQGRTPLKWAEQKGFDKIAQILRPLTNEATGTAKPEAGLSLADAIERWPASMVAQLLEEGHKLPPPPEVGRTAFHQAAHRGDIEIVKLLIPHVQDINERDDLQRTAIIWASLRGNTEVITELAKHEADLNAKSKGNWTALHFAIRQGHQEAAQALINLGADPTATLGEGGKTPLDLNPNMELKVRAE
jgi:ankyrin repeat protein